MAAGDSVCSVPKDKYVRTRTQTYDGVLESWGNITCELVWYIGRAERVYRICIYSVYNVCILIMIMYILYKYIYTCLLGVMYILITN